MIRQSALLICGFFLLCPAFSSAQSTFTGGGDGTTWEDAANWDAGVPTANAHIGDGFTVSLSSDQTINEIDLVGDQNAGTAVLNHTAGTLTGGGWAKVGVNAGNTGTFTMSGTAAMTGHSQLHGGTRGGTGVINLTGSSSYTHSQNLVLAGDDPGGNGTLNISDNAVINTNDRWNIGTQGTGTVNISGNAIANLQNMNTAGGDGNAVVNITGGTINANSWVAIGQGAAGSATFNHSGGTLNAATTDSEFMTIGENGAGFYNASGNAVINVTTGTAGGVLIGRNHNGTTQLGDGRLVMDGSNIDFQTNDLRLATNSDNPGGEGVGTDATGTISWIADFNGVNGGLSTIFSNDNTEFGANSFLEVDLTMHNLFAGYDAAGTIASQILLIDNANAVGGLGTFNGLSEGSLVSIGGGKTATISYVGGDGNDVVLNLLSASAIPEPASAVILGLVGMGMAFRRRRN